MELLIPALSNWGEIGGIREVTGTFGTNSYSLSTSGSTAPTRQSEAISVHLRVDPGETLQRDGSFAVNPKPLIAVAFEEPAGIDYMKTICWAINALISLCSGEINPVKHVGARLFSGPEYPHQKYLEFTFAFDDKQRSPDHGGFVGYLGINWLRLGGVDTLIP